MKNPFCPIEIENAFAPMYNEQAAFTTKSGERQALDVCVFDDVEGETLLEEGSMETNRRNIQLNLRMSDWNFVKTLKRGDAIEIPCRGKFAVVSVQNDPNIGIVVNARSIETARGE